MPKTFRQASLSAKLGTLGALLMLVALGSIAFTVWVTWQLEGGAAAVNEAGRLRMQTWRIAHVAAEADPARLQPLARQFDDSLALLRRGDPARPLFLPRDAATQSALDAVAADWQAMRAALHEAAPPTRHATAVTAEALVRDIDALVGRIESRLQGWTSVLTALQLTLMGLALAGGVALLYAANLFVFQPLARLQQGLQAVEAGDLGARVEVDSDDEYGRVAEGFNRMAARLEDLYRGLEAKVAEKTETLRAERERLAELYEASRAVSAATTVDALAQGFARQLRRVAGADGALLRWQDTDSRRLLLLAADGVSDDFREAERCLQPGTCHCGAGAGEPGAPAVVTLHRLGAADAASPCSRRGIGCVATLPLRLQDQVLGEVTLLWREPGHDPAPEDRALLQGLVSHLASGIEGLRASALQREAAVSEERGFIARELHDSIAQALAFMKIQVQMLRGALRRPDPARVQGIVDELDAGLRESLADVRELLLHFRTRAGEGDLVAALRATLQKFQHQTGLATQVEVRGHALPLAPDLQVQVLHVVQEALSNVRKHAGATQVWLTLAAQPSWHIEVRDDGRGFTPRPDRDDDPHVGLRIMRERAAAIGAQVQVHSAPGTGTRVVVALPDAGSPGPTGSAGPAPAAAGEAAAATARAALAA
jgi:two-component system nitrate/nitrite sensor histidine kinase NarX